MSVRTLDEAVELALKGGCTVVQLREKECSGRMFFDTAVRIKKITDKYGVPLIINDRADIGLAVDTAGVHVGQKDLPADTVRELIGSEKILGVSVSCVEEALKAEKDGADYLGVGAMFNTSTKNDADYVSMEELKKIREAVDIPIVVIGGINENTIPNFKDIGVDGYAVVSAVIAKGDITAATKELLQQINLIK